MTKKESNPVPLNTKKPPVPPAPPEKRIINEDKYWGNNKKKKTVIKLENDEAAFIMNSKQDIKFVFPDMGDEDNVPEYIQFMSALMVVCTTDKEVIELIWEKFHKLIEEEN